MNKNIMNKRASRSINWLGIALTAVVTVLSAMLVMTIFSWQALNQVREVEEEASLANLRAIIKRSDELVMIARKERKEQELAKMKAAIELRAAMAEAEKTVEVKELIEVPKEEAEAVKPKVLAKTVPQVQSKPAYTGEVLNRQNGKIDGPSGVETYYNLNMSKVVEIMNQMGYNYGYWVREDGVKMYGDYVMVAADLSIRPRGSLIETSLGMGIVCDTGEFIYQNPTQLDIAVEW